MGRTIRRAVPLAAGLCLAGCAGAPPPRLAVAPTIMSEDWTPPVAPPGAPLDEGWASFHAPELVRLIEQARAANTDLAVARARVIQARGQLGIARSVGAPTPSLTGTADPGGELR